VAQKEEKLNSDEKGWMKCSLAQFFAGDSEYFGYEHFWLCCIKITRLYDRATYAYTIPYGTSDSIFASLL
jgi:hypothetical protein